MTYVVNRREYVTNVEARPRLSSFRGGPAEIGKVAQKVSLLLGYSLGGNAIPDEASIGLFLRIKSTFAP